MAEKIDPHIVTVSRKKNYDVYSYAAKSVLSKFETCELRGLGEATVNCVRAAEELARQGYATVESFLTDTIQEEGRRRTYKAIITLRKTAEFEAIKKRSDEARANQGTNVLNAK
jgi:hypothetical protein